MDYGRISFTKCGSDEEVASVPYSPIAGLLVRSRLEECDNHKFDGDNTAIGYYMAFYLAELDGKKLVKLPEVEQIKPSDVYAAATRYDITLVNPDGTTDDAADEVEDENPTGTTRESS